MADRCFVNLLPPYPGHVGELHGASSRAQETHEDEAGAEGEHALLSSPFRLLSSPSVLSQRFLRSALLLKKEVVEATWFNVSGKFKKNLSIYTGVLGTAFLCFRSYQATADLDDLQTCRDIVDKCLVESASMRQCPSFHMGPPGIFALGVVAAKCAGSQRDMEQYLKLLTEVGKESALQMGNDDDRPYELLYGSAGYLWATLFVNKQLGYDAVSVSTLRPILDAVIASGRKKGSKACPLMYHWHGKAYWGAAHGLAGIMHCLLHFPLSKEDKEAVKSVLKYMIKNRFVESKNYPSRIENKEDKLVQWCHGAPGVALTLCKAAEVFPEERFKEAALEAGDVVWNRGLVRKVGICHGISGNAYTFLALYRLLSEDVHLHRARAFGLFLLENARSYIEARRIHGGDHPYSLYEGLAGMCCLWLDLVKPKDSRFPGYEI